MIETKIIFLKIIKSNKTSFVIVTHNLDSRWPFSTRFYYFWVILIDRRETERRTKSFWLSDNIRLFLLAPVVLFLCIRLSKQNVQNFYKELISTGKYISCLWVVDNIIRLVQRSLISSIVCLSINFSIFGFSRELEGHLHFILF